MAKILGRKYWVRFQIVYFIKNVLQRNLFFFRLGRFCFHESFWWTQTEVFRPAGKEGKIIIGSGLYEQKTRKFTHQSKSFGKASNSSFVYWSSLLWTGITCRIMPSTFFNFSSGTVCKQQVIQLYKTCASWIKHRTDQQFIYSTIEHARSYMLHKDSPQVSQ